MRKAPAKKAARKNSHELHSLTSSFIKVRILHYAAAGPIGRSAMLLRLRGHDRAFSSASLNRLLASMTRNGWLKHKPIPAGARSAGHAYSLTQKGHRALELAKHHLKRLTCNIASGDAAAFAQEVKSQLASKVSLPQGVYLAYSGSAETQTEARRELLIHSLIAAVGIVLLLAIEFGATRNLLLILANLPFALVGGALAVFATGGLLSIGSLVGFVTLFGITMRNSIMMISHFDHLVQKEGMTWGLEAAIRGASERLLPILMTALLTALGLLPLAIGSGEAGREIEGPWPL